MSKDELMDRAALAELEQMARESTEEAEPTPTEVAAMAAQTGEAATGEAVQTGFVDTPTLPQEAAIAATEAADEEADATTALEPLLEEEAAAPAASAVEAPEPDVIDPFALGNEVAIRSEQYASQGDSDGYIIGRIIYRDENLIRVLPRGVSDRAVEFPLIDGGTEFEPGLIVTDVTLLDVDPHAYYVDFLNVRVGDHLEFFTIDGEKAREDGNVAEIIKSETKDSIKLTDGTTLRFRGRGPPPPIAVIRVVSAPAEDADEAETVEVAAEPVAVEQRRTDLLELLRTTVPVTAAVTVPIGMRGYPDSMQREDLYQDLMERVSAKQRTNPRRIRGVEREVDIAMTLKNSVIRRDESGAVKGVEQTEVNTLADAIRINLKPLPAFVPVVSAALVLNLDQLGGNGLSYNPNDVAPRVLGDVEVDAEVAAESYLEERTGMNFAAYTYDLTSKSGATLSGPAPTEWREDQDVVRTAGYNKAVQGLDIDPASFKKGQTIASLEVLGSNTNDRTIRVLGANRIQEDVLIAPSDPSEVSGYTTLPTKAALALRPPKRPGDLPTALLYSAALQDDNLPTIAETMRELLATGESALNSHMVDAADAATLDLSTWLEAALNYAVHPIDSLGPRGPRLLSVLDSVGLGDVDMSPAVNQVIWAWVGSAQRQWDKLFAEERERINAVLDSETARTFQSVTGDGEAWAESPTWQAIRGSEPLKGFLEDITRSNPAIATAPTMITACLLREAQGDALPLVWSALAKIDDRSIRIDDVAAAGSLEASRAYVFRRRTLRDFSLFQLSAKPEINNCPHVKRLEAIRNLSDVPQRVGLLNEFIKEYQGGRSGDWITCVLCRQNCVCFHEIMELEALAQPTSTDAIHKAMMIQFGGDRYEGKILCKNCGQSLQDIDYEIGVEYDDAGRQIITHSVLTEEQMEEDAEGVSLWKRAMALAEQATIKWDNPEQEYIYSILKMVADRGGLLIPEAVVKLIVQRAETYVTARAPAQAKYEADSKQIDAKRQQLLAAKKLADAAKLPPMPPYRQLTDLLRVSSIMALTTIALQTAQPPIRVNNPHPQCEFSRDGWPLNGKQEPITKESPPSAIRYIGCVVASIAGRKEAPWATLPWEVMRDVGPREAAVIKTLMGAINVIVGGVTSVAMPFTPAVNTELEVMRSDKEAQVEREMVSKTDQLPFGFKPAPFPPKMGRPAVERDPLPNVEAALRDHANVEPMVGPIAKSLTQQAIAIVDELHTAAAAGVIPPMITKDSVCCAMPIGDVEAGSLLGALESANLVAAAAQLRRALPTVPAAGTHFWSEFATPVPFPVNQVVDTGVFFKLFLKYCYVGTNIGELHEFATGNVCRQCGLSLGKPLDLIDFSTEGAAILASQAGPLKVEVTQTEFDRLSDVVRRRKTIEARTKPEEMTWYKGLEVLVESTKGRIDLQEGEGVKVPAAQLRTVLERLKDGNSTGDYELEDRIELWVPLLSLRDDLLAKVTVALGAKSDAAISMFERMTEDPFVEGPRAVQEYWCAKSEAMGNDYGVSEVGASKWFKLGQQYEQDINALLSANANWYKGPTTVDMRKVLRRLGQSLGSLMRAWQRYIRPDVAQNGPWTVSEAQSVLRCFVLQSWYDALTASSWMYRGIDVPGMRQAVADAMKSWSLALMSHVKQQFIRFSKERIREILQERAARERTSIVEEYNIKDPDLLAAFIQNARYGIGRWARGKQIQTLTPDLYGQEAEQRHKMMVGSALGTDGGEAGYDTNQGADGDDY